MISRMRIFAGPNGSGKSTFAHWLSRDYAVNLYRFINADDLFAEMNEGKWIFYTPVLPQWFIRSVYQNSQ